MVDIASQVSMKPSKRLVTCQGVEKGVHEYQGQELEKWLDFIGDEKYLNWVSISGWR